MSQPEKKLSTQPYKGTRDFYPEDMRVRQFIFSNLRQTLTSFGYLEYDGPMLEPFELYASKTSEEIVNEQLYWLVDRGERKLAIRPEMTPTLARMVAAKQNELAKPIRWFSLPNLWRYERPQRGRLREHWQLNVDTFGGQPLQEDSEIAQVIVAIMRGFKATNQYEVRLNHRGVTNYLFCELMQLAQPQITVVGGLLDAANKMGQEAFIKALSQENISPANIDILLQVLNNDPKILAQLKKSADYQHLENLFSNLEALGIRDRFRYDPAIMRGFLYYTGMVLEVYDLHPENNRALFGGGRYDNLVGMFGGSPLAGVGFGLGDVTLRNFLEIHQLLPNFNDAQSVYIAHLSDAEFIASQKLAQTLRDQLITQRSVLTALSADKPKKAFSSAEKLSCRFIIFVGSNEVSSQNYTLKDLKSGEQFSGNVSQLLERLVKA